MMQLCRSYLFAYLVFLGLALGCLGLLLLHALVGGEWGKVGRRVFMAGADTLPWLGALFIPVLLGLHQIYPWMNASLFPGDSFSAAHKLIYFNVPFFIVRALLYFSLWSWLGWRQHQTTKGSAIGLLAYVFTISFASFDWVMSLEPQWSSSIYGVMLLVGDGLSALAFTVLVLQWAERQQGGSSKIPDDTMHDLGNLMLAFVMLWAYMGLSQYLIIWSGNLPEEIGWYLARQRGGWQAVSVILILFQFVLPFLLLLARQRKRQLASLARVAALILALRVVDIFWLTAPDFSPGKFSLHIWDVVMILALGWTWWQSFKRQYEREVLA